MRLSFNEKYFIAQSSCIAELLIENPYMLPVKIYGLWSVINEFWVYNLLIWLRYSEIRILNNFLDWSTYKACCNLFYKQGYYEINEEVDFYLQYLIRYVIFSLAWNHITLCYAFFISLYYWHFKMGYDILLRSLSVISFCTCNGSSLISLFTYFFYHPFTI